MVWKILKYNPGKKSLKAPFSIYLDLESLLKKRISSKKQLWKIVHREKARHEPSGCAILARCLFDEEENKLDYYRGKDCIDELCKRLKERAMKIINYKKNDTAN